MKALLVLSLALVLSACTTTKVALEQTEYTAGNAVKFNVLFLKAKSKGFDVSLNSISTLDKTLLVRKDEVSCGKGTVAGVVKFMKASDTYIVIPAVSFKEFIVICANKELATAEGDRFVKIKSIYESTTDIQPGKVVASNVVVNLK